MTYEQSNNVVLQCLLDDLNNLENQQKGKQLEGNLSDLDVAINCMREEIQGVQNSIQDEKLALSTATAVLADQNVLASIRNDETITEQDHRYALALSNGETPPHDTSALRETESTEENGDTVSAILSDLMSRVRIYDDLANKQDSPPSMLTSPTSSIARECVSCFEKFYTMMFRGSCGHEYCRDCMKSMFIGAIKDEELYPPRCCGDIVPPNFALRVLSYEELRSFCERAIEWTSKIRLYCAEPTCSNFIPPFAIHDEIGTCPSCEQRTHLACRSFAHPGVDCPTDDALHNVLEMAENERWKRCFHCRTMVELQHGCNHITCRCGQEFCYICGHLWKTCDCPLWHENRLTDMANQAIDEELPANANVLERQNAFNRIVEDLRQHEEVGCEHHRKTQWVWRNRGSLQCEFCNHVLPEYIFMCRNCRIRACNRCRRHRVR